MVLDVAHDDATSVDDVQICAIAEREIEALLGAGIVSTAWLWELEGAFPKLAGAIVAALRGAGARVPHRVPGRSADGPRTYEVPVAALGVSRLDFGLFIWGPTLPPTTAPMRESHDDQEPQPPQRRVFSEHLTREAPEWLIASRLAAWASIGVDARGWEFRPEHLDVPLPPCPPLLPGDAIALSMNLDGRAPWVTTEISPEHVVNAAVQLGEPIGAAAARFQRFAGLGVRTSDASFSLLADVQLSAEEPRLVFFRGAPEWQQVLVTAERGCTYGEACAWLRRFEPLGIATVPPPEGAAALRFSRQEVAALTQHGDHARGRIRAASLIEAALSAKMPVDALHDLMQRLGAVGIEVPKLDLDQLRDWLDHPADFAMLRGFLDSEQRLSRVSLVRLSAATRAPISALRDLADACAALGIPCDPLPEDPSDSPLDASHLQLVSRHLNGHAPWKERPLDVAGPADLAVVAWRDTVLWESHITLEQMLSAHDAVGDAMLKTIVLLRRLGDAVPHVTWLALACLSEAGNGMAPWRTGRIPVTHVLRVAADAGVPVGEAANALLRAFGGSGLAGLYARWAALRDTRVSLSQVALLEELDLPDDIGHEDAIAFPQLLFAAVRTGLPLDYLLESLSWLTSLGVRLPPPTGIWEWGTEDVLVLSKNLDGRPPWVGPTIDAGHLLRAAHQLALPLGSTLDRAARLARVGYRLDVPASNADAGAIAKEDLVVASVRLDGEAPWLRGRVDAAHVEAAAAANRETPEVTWRRLQRLAAVLALELPPEPTAKAAPGEAPAGAKADGAISERHAVLYVVGQQGPLRRFSLDRPEVVIGRDRQCDVPLDDHAASRRHCRLARRDDGSFLLIDECSRNGIYVGGKRVFTQRLIEDANIRIGTTRLQLRFTSGPASGSGEEPASSEEPAIS
ncbi:MULTISPECIES: FHA domain-containing protein [Sorangium]|nr:FHA domain-containing protein [Sorangium sp. Soce836]